MLDALALAKAAGASSLAIGGRLGAQPRVRRMVDGCGCRAKPGVLDCTAMKLRHAIMVGKSDRPAGRLHEDQPPSALAERLEMARRARDVDGAETPPQEFANPARTVALVRDCGLLVSAANLKVKSEKK